MTASEALYQEIVLDHARHPRGAGLRAPYDTESRQLNPVCGDEITLRLAVEDGVIIDLSYAATACAISQASASVLSELLTGADTAAAQRTYDAFVALVESRGQDAGDPDVLGDAVAFAGVSRYPARVKCALLPWMAWRDAVTRVAPDRSPRPQLPAPRTGGDTRVETNGRAG